MTALTIPAIWWVGWMNNHWLSRSKKITWLVICSVELVLWLLSFSVLTWWLWDRNNPEFPDNPANSYKACCTPEFYNTVGACPNFGAPHPECDPGINLSELGTNGDIVFFYAVVVLLCIIYIVYLYVSVQVMWETDGYIQYDDPDFPLQATVRFPASATGGTQGSGTVFAQSPPQASGDATPLLPSNSKFSVLTSNALARDIIKGRK